MRLPGQMHTCLNIDEIVRIIACELVASRAKAAVVALARCHKNFEGPVLDTLWKTQDRLLPLLRSLPADVWNEGRCAVSATTIYVLPPLSHLILKVLQKVPDNAGMGSFSKVRPTDAKA